MVAGWICSIRQTGRERGEKRPLRLIAISIFRNCGGVRPASGTTLAPTEATTGLLPWRGRVRGVRSPWKETRTPPLWPISEAEADPVGRCEPGAVPPQAPVPGVGAAPASREADDDTVPVEEPPPPS